MTGAIQSKIMTRIMSAKIYFIGFIDRLINRFYTELGILILLCAMLIIYLLCIT